MANWSVGVASSSCLLASVPVEQEPELRLALLCHNGPGTRGSAGAVELHMARSPSGRDALLAVALGSRRRDEERRRFPDRRSGVERRQASCEVSSERRSERERRQTVRRKEDLDDGATLLQKARSRLPRRKGGTDWLVIQTDGFC